MKKFKWNELEEALIFAAQGGQSLHVHSFIPDNAPECFKKSKQIAHLFDSDIERLNETVKKLGVGTIVIHKKDTVRQHVDLCGKPLDKAIELSE